MDDSKVPPETIPTTELLALLRPLAEENGWCVDLEGELTKQLGITFKNEAPCYCDSCSTDDERENRLTMADDAPATVTLEAVVAALAVARRDYAWNIADKLEALVREQWGIESTASVAR